MAIDYNGIYQRLDKMQKMKRYRPPTEGFFPSVPELNTYAVSPEKFKYMIPYIMWLDECLTDGQRAEHRPAINRFNEILASLDESDIDIA